MLKLLSENSYDCNGLTITVAGLNCDQLSKIYPICSAMDRKVKARLIEIVHNEELANLLLKRETEEGLSKEESVKLAGYFQEHSEDFTMQECVDLAEAYLDNIIKVMQGEEDVTDDFKNGVLSSPKFLKSLANIIQLEYKEATEVSEAKKL